MRIGIRSAISALVLTSIIVSAVGVHLVLWRPAQQVSQTLADTNYTVADQEWFRVAIDTNDEHWSTFSALPSGPRLAAAFAAPIEIDQKPAGVIAIIIELTRVSNFLSQLTVGKSAGAFILERNGKVVAAPDPNANEAVALKTDHPLFPIAVEAIQNASAYEPGDGQPFNTKVTRDGNGARLGGAVRPMSVMFIDLAGFTGMSERLGDRIIPLLSRYFDSVSVQIQNQNGTIDKFIGDAVMAFWGAPSPNPDHAVDCCRAALACRRAVEEAGLVDDHGQPVKIRIGINSGDMLVGNIGSEVRLNYTVIGDAVNIASRLESTNKAYGSTIIIGPETRRLGGKSIGVAELDRLE